MSNLPDDFNAIAYDDRYGCDDARPGNDPDAWKADYRPRAQPVLTDEAFEIGRAINRFAGRMMDTRRVWSVAQPRPEFTADSEGRN